MEESRIATWKSLWAPLLRESAEAAKKSFEKSDPALSSVVSGIVLARTSWETYVNELIEWRDLPRSIKRKSFQSKIKTVHAELDSKQPDFGDDYPWSSLNLVNHVRNAIVHHHADPLAVGSSPRNVLDRLQALAVIESVEDDPWEEQVLCSSTARWASLIVGDSILALEDIPNRRRRSYADVKFNVQDSLEPIAGLH